MDENQVQSGSKAGWIAGAVIAVLAVAGIAAYVVKNRAPSAANPGTESSNVPAGTGTPAPQSGVIPPPPAATSSSAVSKITVNVSGGKYYFNPKEIRVKKGQVVTIHFTNADGMHNWVLDEFNAATPVIQSGQTADVTFTADKTGSFEYYCSVGNHRAMGMKGTLVVQ